MVWLCRKVGKRRGLPGHSSWFDGPEMSESRYGEGSEDQMCEGVCEYTELQLRCYGEDVAFQGTKGNHWVDN